MRYELLTALAFVPSLTFAIPFTHDSTLQARNIVDTISDAYDFVIVGGGVAGLVLG